MGFSFIFLTVNLFRHSTPIEHGLYCIFIYFQNFIYVYIYVLKELIPLVIL